MSKLGGIDYSKWDHIEDSDDSDNDNDTYNNNYNNNNAPRVTKLDQPGSVTWTNDGSVTVRPNPNPNPNPNPQIPSPSTSSISKTITHNNNNDNSNSKYKHHPQKIIPSTDTTKKTINSSQTNKSKQRIEFVKSSKKNNDTNDNDQMQQMKELYRNGSVFQDSQTHECICWSQTRSEVLITIPFDSQAFASKSLQVKVIPSSTHPSHDFSNIKGKNPILPYSNRHCAVGGVGCGNGASDANDAHDAESENHGNSVDKGTLIVTASNNAITSKNPHVFLKGQLPHFIHGTQEEEEEGEENEKHDRTQVEWEVINDCSIRYGNSFNLLSSLSSLSETNQMQASAQRISDINPNYLKMIQITLRKAVPMYGMYIWWDQPLTHCPKINVSTIADRNLSTSSSKSMSTSNNDQDMNPNTPSHEQKKQTLLSAWEEAHVLFREKMKNKSTSNYMI